MAARALEDSPLAQTLVRYPQQFDVLHVLEDDTVSGQVGGDVLDDLLSKFAS